MGGRKVFVLLMYSVIAFDQCCCDDDHHSKDINGFQFEVLLTQLSGCNTRMESYVTSLSHIVHVMERLETLIEDRYKSMLQQMEEKVVKLETHIADRLEKSSSLITCAVNNQISTHSTQILDKIKQMESKTDAIDSRTTSTLSKINNRMEESGKALQSYMEKQAKNIVANQTNFVQKIFKQPSIAREGTWNLIQRRFDGSENFFRGWNDYKNGFGNEHREYWIGLEKMHRLTARASYELLVVLEDFDGDVAYAHCGDFAIGDETEKYALKRIGSCSGTAGNALREHKGMPFSTYDRDNNYNVNGNCASKHQGGWWFRSSGDCMYSNLNGKYYNQSDVEHGMGVNWFHFRFDNYSLKSSKMMIRLKT